MLNSWYLAGLADGEGCFCISISKHKSNKTGLDARLIFEIEMVMEDKPLLQLVQAKLKCGQIYDLSYERYGWRPHVKYAVKNIQDIKKKVIPFFKKYRLQGKKSKDFDYFCQALTLFEKKEHTTLEGIKKLREIQLKMNLRQKRKWSSAKVRENREPGGEGDK